MLIFYGITSDRNNFYLENYFHGEHAFHTPHMIESPYITRTVDLGFAFVHFTNSNNAGKLRNKIPHIDGESVTINRRDTRSIINHIGAQYIKSQTIGELTTTYAYTSRIPHTITMNNRRINLQIAHRTNTTTIGWPVILGSF